MDEVMTKRRQPELIRARIIDAGINLLATVGVLSISTVADAAGVTKGAVQHHFRTRDELVQAIYDQMLGVFEASVVDDGQGDPAAWRYARCALELRAGEPSSQEWRALMVATVVEKRLATQWADWVAADRKADGNGSTGKLLARLASDGLWLSEMLGTYEISDVERKALNQAIRELATKAEKL